MNYINKMKHKISVRNLIFALIPSVLMSLFFTVGYFTKYEKGLTVTVLRVLFMFALAIVLTGIVYFLYCSFDALNLKPVSLNTPFFNRKFKSSCLYFWFSFAVILIMWLPSLLALYPGIYAYDASWQLEMYQTCELSTHQPILHTFLLGFCIDTILNITGSMNKGVLAYTIVQMLIMDFGLSYVFYDFHKRKVPAWQHIFSYIIFCFYPVFVIFVFTSTKDSILAVAILDFVLVNLRLLQDKKAFFEEKKNIVLFIILAFIICAFRNNAVYALIIILPFWCAAVFKSDADKKKAILLLVITAAILGIYKYPVTRVLASETVSKAEMLSVPCQQIMRVKHYHQDELSDDQEALINKFFDGSKWYNYYVPEIADATKGSLKAYVYEENKKEFYGLWLELLKKYPYEYVDSFLENTYGLWYPWPHYVLYSFGQSGYTNITTMEPSVANPKIRFLYDFYKEFENGKIVEGAFAVSWLFAPATFLYLTLIIAFYTLKEHKNNKDLWIPLLFTGLYFNTFLCGPAALVRYSLYLFLMPVILPEFVRKRV